MAEIGTCCVSVCVLTWAMFYNSSSLPGFVVLVHAAHKPSALYVCSYLNRDLGRFFLSRALFYSLQIQYKLPCSIYLLSLLPSSQLFWFLFYRNSFHPPPPHPHLLGCSHITRGPCVQHSLTPETEPSSN